MSLFVLLLGISLYPEFTFGSVPMEHVTGVVSIAAKHVRNAKQ